MCPGGTNTNGGMLIGPTSRRLAGDQLGGGRCVFRLERLRTTGAMPVHAQGGVMAGETHGVTRYPRPCGRELVETKTLYIKLP